jgi:hypothetical protein
MHQPGFDSQLYSFIDIFGDYKESHNQYHGIVV